MIIGAHTIISSTDADADRAFLRDVLGFGHVDAGGGWLIFGLPPAEVAVHPSEENGAHELFLMCDDVKAFIADMNRRKVACTPMQTLRWGLLTQITLPGGSQLGVYQPLHALATSATAKPKSRASKKKKPAVRANAKKKAAKKKAAKKKK
jgi:hypothetical protein